MKRDTHSIRGVFVISITASMLAWIALTEAAAQSPAGGNPPPAAAGEAAATPAPPGPPAAPPAATDGGPPASPAPASPSPAPDAPKAARTSGEAKPEAIQVSFKGVEIDFVVKWLAETTGKSVVKENSVNPKLTIVSPRKLSVPEALELVYQSLALHKIAVVENGNVILLVPEELGRKMGPQALDTSTFPEGSQIIAKVIELEHAEAGKLKDKLKGVLSEQAKLEVDERANKIIVTDTANNVRLLQELISQLDVRAASETTTAVFPLKHARADDLVAILKAIFGSPLAGVPQQKGKPAPKVPKLPGANIRFMPDKMANRIIVTAPPDRIPEIRDLIETLDQDKPADVTVRVLPLRHADAESLSNELGPMYQKLKGESMKDVIEVGANSRSNSLIVLSSKKNFDTIKELVDILDTQEAQEKVMKSFPLKNADADEVAEHLTELYEPQDRSYRYYSYYSYSSRSRSRKGEVRFVADRRRNAVIAIGPPGSLENIGEMVKALDAPVDGESLLPRIYQLKYVSAFDVEELLNELFTKKTRRRGYYDWEYGYDEVERDIGKLYGKVRVTSEYYSNSIIVSSNSEENFEAIENILKQLDRPSETGDTTVTVSLKFAKAVTIANNLNIIFAQDGAPPRRQGRQQQRDQQRPNQQQGRPSATSASFELEEEVYEESYFPWIGSSQGGDRRSRSGRVTRPVSDLVGKVRVVPDMRTNTLLVSSNTHLLPEILHVIEDLDVPTAQVLIEARIVEVGTDYRDRLGVRWSPDGSQIFDAEDLDDSIIGSGRAEYTEVFAGTVLADAMRTGILSGSVNLDLLIQFLRKNTTSNVRAEPRINVEDNERGKLFVGSRVPFIAGSLQTVEGGRNDTFEYIDVGITLEVTPHINANGDVALGVRVESSQIRPGETLFGGAIIDTRNYRTDLTVQNGETLVLGGIIQKEQSEVVRKFPILGDIPLLGWLFKKKDTIDRDVELMVFLRPTVTRTPEEVRKLMEAEREKMRHIRRWEEELEAKRTEEEGEEEEDGDGKGEEEAEGKGKGKGKGEGEGEGNDKKDEAGEKAAGALTAAVEPASTGAAGEHRLPILAAGAQKTE